MSCEPNPGPLDRVADKSVTKEDGDLRRCLATLAALTVVLLASLAHAQPIQDDPIGNVLLGLLDENSPGSATYQMKASLYHAGARGVGALDSLGCRVVAMRTAAIDAHVIPKRTVLFIKETVGLPMPDGSLHDGHWYASDTGGGIRGLRIDLFTGSSSSSTAAFRHLNMTQLSVSAVGVFQGCPPN